MAPRSRMLPRQRRTWTESSSGLSFLLWSMVYGLGGTRRERWEEESEWRCSASTSGSLKRMPTLVSLLFSPPLVPPLSRLSSSLVSPGLLVKRKKLFSFSDTHFQLWISSLSRNKDIEEIGDKSLFFFFIALSLTHFYPRRRLLFSYLFQQQSISHRVWKSLLRQRRHASTKKNRRRKIWNIQRKR